MQTTLLKMNYVYTYIDIKYYFFMLFTILWLGITGAILHILQLFTFMHLVTIKLCAFKYVVVVLFPSAI